MNTIKETSLEAIDIVESPDDGGFYLRKMSFVGKKLLTSKKIYATARLAKDAFRERTVRWEA